MDMMQIVYSWVFMVNDQCMFQCVLVSFYGCMFFVFWEECDCVVVDMLLGDVYIELEVCVNVGDCIIVYIDYIGCIEGEVFSFGVKGYFVILVNVMECKCEKFVVQFIWIVNKYEFGLFEDCCYECFVLCNNCVEIVFDDGCVYFCWIIDFLFLGVVIEIFVCFVFGIVVQFGNMCGCVVCYFQEGVVIEFLVLQMWELFFGLF